MSFQTRYAGYKALVEGRLESCFGGDGLEEVMRYSLLAGGKRLRPVLTLAFCAAAGGAPEEALDFACGVEMLHTYSLIHDDLPCMDNDDLRRGKPTCHKVYGQTAAVLAGDALQAAAFRMVAAGGTWEGEASGVPARAAGVLAEAAGERGMCLGQYWDAVGDGCPRAVEELTAVHAAKTGALLRAACTLGLLASSGHRAVEGACFDAAGAYAANLGLAFQIKDDMLDVTSTAETLGKPIGSDRAQGKTTYMTLLGPDECEKRVEDYTRRAKAALEQGSWRGGTGFLRDLADEMARRSR